MQDWGIDHTVLLALMVVQSCARSLTDTCCAGQICRKDQIRIKNIPAAQAKGVTVARYETQQLLADEKFWFQVTNTLPNNQCLFER